VSQLRFPAVLFVVFRILVNLVDNGDKFLVTVHVIAVLELIIACSDCSWRGLILAF
jgi:hypothetical protein